MGKRKNRGHRSPRTGSPLQVVPLQQRVAEMADDIATQSATLVPIAGSLMDPAMTSETLPIRIADVVDEMKRQNPGDPEMGYRGNRPSPWLVPVMPVKPIVPPVTPVLPLSQKPDAVKADEVEPSDKKPEGVEQPEASGEIDLHKTAARVQRAMSHLGVIVWYGDVTSEFWVMGPTGLRSFKDLTSMYQGMSWEEL